MTSPPPLTPAQIYLAYRNTIPDIKLGPTTMNDVSPPPKVAYLFALDGDQLVRVLDDIPIDALYATFAIPITQLLPAEGQRPINPSHVSSILQGFGDTPTQRMNSNQLVVVPENPDQWPTLSAGHPNNVVLFLCSLRAIARIYAGQHRIEAIRAWLRLHNIPECHGFWICKVLYPGVGALPLSSRTALVNFSNIILPSSANNSCDELVLLAAASVQSYLDNKPSAIKGWLDTGITDKSFAKTSLKEVATKMSTIPELAAAIVNSDLLSAETEVWRTPDNGLGAYMLVYYLESAHISYTSQNLIYACKALLNKLSLILGRPVRISDFKPPPGIELRDGGMKEAPAWMWDSVKANALEYNIPELLLCPSILRLTEKAGSSVLRQFLEETKEVMHAVAIIVLGSQGALTAWTARQAKSEILFPARREEDLWKVVQDALLLSASNATIEAWKQKMLKILTPTHVHVLLSIWATEVRAVVKHKLGDSVSKLLKVHGQVYGINGSLVLGNAIEELMKTDTDWYDLMVAFGLQPGSALGVHGPRLMPLLSPAAFKEQEHYAEAEEKRQRELEKNRNARDKLQEVEGNEMRSMTRAAERDKVEKTVAMQRSQTLLQQVIDAEKVADQGDIALAKKKEEIALKEDEVKRDIERQKAALRRKEAEGEKVIVREKQQAKADQVIQDRSRDEIKRMEDRRREIENTAPNLLENRGERSAHCDLVGQRAEAKLRELSAQEQKLRNDPPPPFIPVTHSHLPIPIDLTDDDVEEPCAPVHAEDFLDLDALRLADVPEDAAICLFNAFLALPRSSQVLLASPDIASSLETLLVATPVISSPSLKRSHDVFNPEPPIDPSSTTSQPPAKRIREDTLNKVNSPCPPPLFAVRHRHQFGGLTVKKPPVRADSVFGDEDGNRDPEESDKDVEREDHRGSDEDADGDSDTGSMEEVQID